MSSLELSSLEQLDEQQRRVAEAPADARLVVTAGPGSGKTRTLIERARCLLDRYEVDASELLILSFSRAAVETVSSRSRQESDLGRLPVMTFDGFASRLLFQMDVDCEGVGFDGQIEMAEQIVASGRAMEEIDWLGDLRHVLVDEAQDVVSIRAGFVTALLSALCKDGVCGFTLFGDAAQAIYDFQFDDRSRPGDRRRLLTWGVERLPGPIETVELSRNYRMEPDRLAPLADSVGARIRGQFGDGVETWEKLKDELSDFPAWLDYADAAGGVSDVAHSPDQPSVAILCRTNAEVLELGSRLQAEGLDLRVQHRAEDRGGAPWLAACFSDVKFTSGRVPAVDADGLPWVAVPGDALRRLRRANVARKDEVDLRRLAVLLRNGVCPEELVVRREAPITISTIHRAKGLEFDHVIVIEPWRTPDDDEGWEEARVLYVAATRPRDGLESAPPMKLGGPVKYLNGSKRVAVCTWARKKRPCRIEVRVSDSAMDWTAGSRDEAVELQTYLANEYKPGDEVSLSRVSEEGADFPTYEAVHHGRRGERVVAATSEDFGRLIAREVWGRHPLRITGLTAEVPDTAAFSPAVSRRLGWGEHGLHLRARFYGLGLLRFTRDD